MEVGLDQRFPSKRFLLSLQAQVLFNVMPELNHAMQAARAGVAAARIRHSIVQYHRICGLIDSVEHSACS